MHNVTDDSIKEFGSVVDRIPGWRKLESTARHLQTRIQFRKLQHRATADLQLQLVIVKCKQIRKELRAERKGRAVHAA